MNDSRDDELRKILSEVGLVNDNRVGLDWWISQRDRYKTPILEIALFLRESWRGIITDDAASVESLLGALQKRAYDDDGYQSKKLRENGSYVSVLKEAMKDPELCSAITYLVRSAQIEAVFSLMVLLDGGESFDDGNLASWGMAALDENSDPSQTFGDVKELFWHFDPESRT